MQGQEAIFSFKVLKSSAYKDARALQVKKKMVSQTQKLPIVQYWYRYRLRLQGKTSIGFGIEFEKIWQSANIRFRTQTNVYRPTLGVSQKVTSGDGGLAYLVSQK